MIEHLNELEMRALLDLVSVAESLKIPLMLVGANARRLAFDIPFGFPSPRTTEDWDFAARMPNWDVFARIYQQAVDGPFRPGDSAHRIIHKDTGILVDLVPFGPLTGTHEKIHWPQSQQVMSVLGFEDACDSCVHEKLPNGMEIGIVTPSLLAVLKMIAYAERGEQFPRDLQDLWFIMERYARPPAHENRAFDELVEHFPDDETYYEHLDSLLLGWDIGRKCRPMTLAAIQPIIKELSSEESPRIEALLSRTGDEEDREVQRRKITSEFGWLQTGIALATTASLTL